MKTSIAKLALGLTLVSVSSIAMAGISTTRHNLGSSGLFNTTSATTEICVFCHTPHGADTSAAVPLWNRKLGTAGMYQTYASLGTTTLDAAAAPTGSVSLACLSCHDGTQAMNVVINTPGSGTTGNINVTTDAAGNTSYISKASGANCAATDGSCGGFKEFNFMSQVSNEMIYIGTDLRNDHPVSIQYAGNVPGQHGVLDPDFKSAISTQINSGQTVFFIDTNADGVKQKSDLPLYNRTTGAMAGQALIECATCHDPHTNNTTFLRNPAGNNGSATCLSCHVK